MVQKHAGSFPGYRTERQFAASHAQRTFWVFPDLVTFPSPSALSLLKVPILPVRPSRLVNKIYILDDRPKGTRMSEQLIVTISVSFQFKTGKFLSPSAFGKIS